MRYIISFIAGVMTASTVFMTFICYSILDRTPHRKQTRRVSYTDFYDEKDRA